MSNSEVPTPWFLPCNKEELEKTNKTYLLHELRFGESLNYVTSNFVSTVHEIAIAQNIQSNRMKIEQLAEQLLQNILKLSKGVVTTDAAFYCLILIQNSRSKSKVKRELRILKIFTIK